MFEQLRRTVNTHIMPNMDILKTEQENTYVRLVQLTQEDNQYSSDMGNSTARLHEAQEDLTGMLRTLARQVENLQGGTKPMSTAQPLLSWM